MNEPTVVVVDSIAADLFFVLQRKDSLSWTMNHAGQPDEWHVDSYWESPLAAQNRADFLKGRR